MPKPLVIDLSHHNTVKSLHDAAAAGIVGVIHKATEGVKMVDKTVKDRFALTRDAGMLWGVYHFMRPGDVEAQVDHFLKNAPADEKTLYVLDFEVDGISLSQVLEFLELVEERTGQIPVLYTGFKLKDLGGAVKVPALAAYRLWLAQYGATAKLPKGYDKLWLWQYTQTGKIAGITGNCDLNAYNGTPEQLRQDWVIKTSAAAPLITQTPATDNNSVESEQTAQPPPIQIEQTNTETKQEDGVVKQEQTTLTTPKGDPPTATPTQVTTRGPLAMWLFSGGGLMTIGTAVWGIIQANLGAVAVGILCFTFLVCIIIFRHAITDAIRMQTAADPDKKNVT